MTGGDTQTPQRERVMAYAEYRQVPTSAPPRKDYLPPLLQGCEVEMPKGLPPTLSILIALCALSICNVSLALPSPRPDLEDHVLQTVKLVNEVGSRRRVNTIFPNPQAARDGVQVAYINTTSGNLTFSTRDIVIPGPLPIMFGRVYDSRHGWRLTYAASFTRTDTGFVLRDATGSHLFIDAGHGVENFRNFRNYPR